MFPNLKHSVLSRKMKNNITEMKALTKKGSIRRNKNRKTKISDIQKQMTLDEKELESKKIISRELLKNSFNTFMVQSDLSNKFNKLQISDNENNLKYETLDKPIKSYQSTLQNSLKSLPKRDTSYRLENNETVMKENDCIEELYKILGLKENKIENTLPEDIKDIERIRDQLKSEGTYKFLDTQTKLNSTIRDNEKPHILLSRNIFLEIPKEFMLKYSKSIEEILNIKSCKIGDFSCNSPSRTSDNHFAHPSNRNDAIILNNWFYTAMNKLINIQDQTSENKFELAQTIYFICFKEIIKQVSVKCIDRGILLWRIWKGYISIIESMNNQFSIILKNELNKYLERSDYIQEKFEKKLKKFQNKLEEANNKISELVKENESIKKVNEKYEKLIEALKNENEEQKLQITKKEKFCEELTKKCRERKSESNRIKTEIEKLANLFPQIKVAILESPILKIYSKSPKQGKSKGNSNSKNDDNFTIKIKTVE